MNPGPCASIALCAGYLWRGRSVQLNSKGGEVPGGVDFLTLLRTLLVFGVF